MNYSQKFQQVLQDPPAISASGEGEWYVVTVATFVNVYPKPDDTSSPVLGRKCRDESVLLFEWDETRTWRRCKLERPGGPPSGWVKVLTWKYGPLMVPMQERTQLNKLCQLDTSGALGAVLSDECEENVQKHVPDMLREKRDCRSDFLRNCRQIRTSGSDLPLHIDSRLVLGPHTPPVSQRVFDRVVVFGAHHTCTTALTRELEAQFAVTVENNYSTVLPDSRPQNHKHRVLEQPPNPQNAFIICLIKEPCFWLQSLTRAGATYAIRALQQLPDGSLEDMERHVGPMEQRTQEELLDAILGTVEFFGDVYPNGGALRVWEASVRSYFNDTVCPLARTAVVRCEDFLFNFVAVMEALGRRGLQRRAQPPPPNGIAAKSGVIHYKARNREEALCWYSEEKNRRVGLEDRHVRAVAYCLGDMFLGPLGYGEDAVTTWSSRPGTLCIAGSWRSFQPVPMAWDSQGFLCDLRMGRAGREHFQLLREGSWDEVFYPSVPEPLLDENYEILGPDASGHGQNWLLGKRDGARPGDLCQITVQVDAAGKPERVQWRVVKGRG